MNIQEKQDHGKNRCSSDPHEDLIVYTYVTVGHEAMSRVFS